jgi:hypothetical protein
MDRLVNRFTPDLAAIRCADKAGGHSQSGVLRAVPDAAFEYVFDTEVVGQGADRVRAKRITSRRGSGDDSELVGMQSPELDLGFFGQPRAERIVVGAAAQVGKREDRDGYAR